MKSFILLTAAAVAAALPSSELLPRQAGQCNIAGTGQKVQPYWTSSATQYRTAAQCGTRCLQDAQCVTYATGLLSCRLYTANVAAVRNGNLAIYSFSDRSCAPKPTTTTAVPSPTPTPTVPPQCGIQGTTTATPFIKYIKVDAVATCKTVCTWHGECQSALFIDSSSECDLYTKRISAHVTTGSSPGQTWYDRGCA